MPMAAVCTRHSLVTFRMLIFWLFPSHGTGCLCDRAHFTHHSPLILLWIPHQSLGDSGGTTAPNQPLIGWELSPLSDMIFLPRGMKARTTPINEPKVYLSILIPLTHQPALPHGDCLFPSLTWSLTVALSRSTVIDCHVQAFCATLLEIYVILDCCKLQRSDHT
jgi:hypothetical protein